ncbi:hypothetical protein [Amorphus suaedae]
MATVGAPVRAAVEAGAGGAAAATGADWAAGALAKAEPPPPERSGRAFGTGAWARMMDAGASVRGLDAAGAAASSRAGFAAGMPAVNVTGWRGASACEDASGIMPSGAATGASIPTAVVAAAAASEIRHVLENCMPNLFVGAPHPL